MYIYIIYIYNIYVNVKSKTTHTCKELQKPSVTKTHSAGFDHNPKLPNKKRIQMLKSF